MIDSDFNIIAQHTIQMCVCVFSLLTADSEWECESVKIIAWNVCIPLNSFFSLFKLLWSTMLFFLLLLMLLKVVAREKMWEFDWISMCKMNVARYWNPIEFICVWERSVGNVRGFHRTLSSKKMWQNNKQSIYDLWQSVKWNWLCVTLYAESIHYRGAECFLLFTHCFCFCLFVRVRISVSHLTNVCSKWHEILEGFAGSFHIQSDLRFTY